MLSVSRFSLLALLALSASASAASFEFTAPPQELRETYAKKGTRFEFGYLTVPENRSQPSGRTIQIAVAIFRAEKPAPGSLPVFFLTGGPGGSCTTFADTFSTFPAIRKTHDLVMIDQRGTGYSKPFLDLDSTDGLRSVRATRDGYLTRGIDLSAYNTSENAADIADLRTALGYSRIIIFGNSYGTFLAQEVMRSHPQGIAAAVLNGVLPAASDFIPSYNHNARHGLIELFRDVRRTGPARRAFPHLQRTYFSLLRQLARRPIRFSGVKVTLDKMQSTMSALLQSPDRIRLIPLLVSDVRDRRASDRIRRIFDIDEESLPITAVDRSQANGMYLSVLGSDWNEPGWMTMTRASNARLTPAIFRTSNAPSTEEVAREVGVWNVPYMPRSTRTPLRSAIPTLLLNGRMEAQTPPDGGDVVSAGLSRAFNLTFPRSGHITGLTSGPAQQAILQFLADPSRHPRVSLARLKRPDFYAMRASTAKARDAGLETPLIRLP